MYLNDIYTVSANLAGIPGISVPCGFSGEGLPIGFQLVGKSGRKTFCSISQMFTKKSFPFEVKAKDFTQIVNFTLKKQRV